MNNIRFFKRTSNVPIGTAVVQTAKKPAPYALLDSNGDTITAQLALYDKLREAVPIIDAAITKTIRLTGGYQLSCDSKKANTALANFVDSVNVGGVGVGLECFITTYLDSLLTYGNAVGEIVLNSKGDTVMGLYNAPLGSICLKEGSNPLEVIVYCSSGNNEWTAVKQSNLILHSALNKKPSSPYGTSILKGLPFVSSVLLRVYDAIAQNFERVGNIRYAVTYKPSNDSVDKAYAKERATQIAKEWADGMNATKNGQVTDFISVGDVSIKVIGAENQMIDTNIPVRQMLEQIVSKLSIPPFLLGLSWSSTERMSKQQCDILTSELDYYRRLLTPIILKICRTFLRLNGFDDEPKLSWNLINLQDEAEHARSMLYQAQAKKIYTEIEKEGQNGQNSETV